MLKANEVLWFSFRVSNPCEGEASVLEVSTTRILEGGVVCFESWSSTRVRDAG